VSVYDDGGAEVGGDVDIDAHLDAEVDDAVDGDGDDLDGYETAYYEQAGAFGRDTIYAAADDGDDVDEEGRARHMAGGRSPELWAGLVDRISSWPIWLQLALPVSAMVILLGGIGIALADTGGGQPDRTASTETDDSGEHAAGDSLTTSSSSLSSTTTRPGASSSSTSSSLPGSTTTVAGGDGSTDGPPPGEGGAAGPPPSSSNPTSPSTTTARPPSTTTPTTAPQDPYRYCEGLERLFPTDPDGDGTYCE
jgi:FlaG/FlaF family flagellin (archaellin)